MTEKINKSELKKIIMNDATKNYILRSATIEILDFCNYKCGHCYVHDSYNTKININDFKKVIDQLKVLGCLWLTITGGEPLMHPDFIEMYEYAFSKLANISLFTNGSLIEDIHIDLFKKKPPYELEISLYGINENEYDDFVGNNGAYKLYLKNLCKLKLNDINFSLKTTITKKNYNEISSYKKFAKMFDAFYRFDTYVAPYQNGIVDDITNYRLAPEDAYKIIMEKEGLVDKLKEELRNSVEDNDDNLLYTCDGPKSSVFINAKLEMSYCVLVREPKYELNKQEATIKNGQLWLIDKFSQYLDSSDKCYSCKYKPFCRYCPGRFFIETGNERIPLEWNCRFGTYIYNSIVNEE